MPRWQALGTEENVVFDLIEVNRITLSLLWVVGVVCGYLIGSGALRKDEKPKRRGPPDPIRHGRMGRW